MFCLLPPKFVIWDVMLGRIKFPNTYDYVICLRHMFGRIRGELELIDPDYNANFVIYITYLYTIRRHAWGENLTVKSNHTDIIPLETRLGSPIG